MGRGFEPHGAYFCRRSLTCGDAVCSTFRLARAQLTNVRVGTFWEHCIHIGQLATRLRAGIQGWSMPMDALHTGFRWLNVSVCIS